MGYSYIKFQLDWIAGSFARVRTKPYHRGEDYKIIWLDGDIPPGGGTVFYLCWAPPQSHEMVGHNNALSSFVLLYPLPYFSPLSLCKFFITLYHLYHLLSPFITLYHLLSPFITFYHLFVLITFYHLLSPPGWTPDNSRLITSSYHLQTHELPRVGRSPGVSATT